LVYIQRKENIIGFLFRAFEFWFLTWTYFISRVITLLSKNQAESEFLKGKLEIRDVKESEDGFRTYNIYCYWFLFYIVLIFPSSANVDGPSYVQTHPGPSEHFLYSSWRLPRAPSWDILEISWSTEVWILNYMWRWNCEFSYISQFPIVC
jgi:hypothetical protein